MNRYPVLIRRVFVLPLLRAVSWLGVVFAAGMTLVVLAPSPAVAYVPPAPPPPAFLTELLTGSGVYTLPAGVAVGDGLILVQAGAGAYEGTCMLLKVTLGGSCDAGSAVDGIFNLLTTGSWAGTFPSYTGPSVIINPSEAWSPTSTTADVRLFVQNSGGISNTNTYMELRFVNVATGALFNYQSPNTFYLCNRTNMALIVGNANSPRAYMQAWNAAYPATCQISAANIAAAPDTGYAVAQVGVCSNWNQTFGTMAGCSTQWTSGYGPPTAQTATFTETCTNTNGTTFTRSAATTYTPAAGAKSPDVHLPNCWDIQPGAVRTHVGVGVVKGGTTIETASVPLVDPAWATKYPDCVSSKCLLTPQYVPTLTKCYDGTTSVVADDCVDLWPQEGTNPAPWRCFWGSYRVPLSFCEDAYPKKYFTVDTRNPTDPGSDPTTPTQTTPPAPCQTNCTEPSIPADPLNPKDGGQSCMSGAFSWNPINWVYVPVKCVLKWAFVPSSGAFSDAIGGLKDSWIGSTPGVWVGAIGDLVPSGSLSGCQGPAFSFDFQSVHVNTHPFSACSGGAATAATFVRLVLSIGCVVAGGFGCLRAIGSGFGWRPGAAGADA